MDLDLDAYTATDLLAVCVGGLLLFYGRRLYWLALGGAGFFLGLWLAIQLFDLQATPLGLGIGFLIGVLGAVLVTLAQRMAVGLAGFVVGGTVGYWLAGWIGAPLDLSPGPWIWVLAALGAVLGTFLAASLFATALVAFTSLLGAATIALASDAGAPAEGWIFLILLIVGVIVQSSRERRRAASR